MGPKDPFRLIEQEHDFIKELFERIQNAPDEELMEAAREEIRILLEAEEEVFYPRVRALSEALDRKARRADAEHAEIKGLLSEISELPAEETPDFYERLQELREIVEQHFKEEEEEVLPLVREKLPKIERREMARRLEERMTAFESGG